MPAKIAVIGGGVFGEMHLKTFNQMQERGEVELVGLADIDAKVRKRRGSQYHVKTYDNVRRMLKETKPDGVTIVTPDHAHLRVTLDALRAGCHVMVEKPMAQSVADCQKMIDAARAGKRLLMVDFHKRFSTQNLGLKQAIGRAQLGRVLYAYGWMEDRIEVPRDWWPHWACKSSPMWFLGVHMIDLFGWASGLRATHVVAGGQRSKLTSCGVKTYDAIQAQIRFAGGATYALHVSWILPEQFEAIVNQGIRVVGTDGIFEVDGQDRGDRSCLANSPMSTYNLDFYRELERPEGGFEYGGYGIEAIEAFAHHLNALLDGCTLSQLKGRYASGEEGREVTRIAEAAHKSLRTGKPVRIG